MNYKTTFNNGFRKFASIEEEHNTVLKLFDLISELLTNHGVKFFNKNNKRNVLGTLYTESKKRDLGLSNFDISYLLNKYYFYNGHYTIIKIIEGNTNRNKFLKEDIYENLWNDIKINNFTVRNICQKYNVSASSICQLKKYKANDCQFQDEHLFEKLYEEWLLGKINSTFFSDTLFQAKGNSSILFYFIKERNLPYCSFFHKLIISAKTRNIPLTLTGHDIRKIYLDQNKKCYFSNKPLKIFFRSCEIDDSCISIDRINNHQGYTKENIRIVSKEFNFFKNCKSDDVFYKNCIQGTLKKLELMPKTEKIKNAETILNSILNDMHVPEDTNKTFETKMTKYLYEAC